LSRTYQQLFFRYRDQTES